jgi:hypothetical protein
MANSTLQTFLEDRLKALDPSTDISAGSPAQTQFIEPVLTKLGTDPFETDLDAFILDRFAQEFPDLYAGDPSVVRDIFIKPLIVLLDPFKREIAGVTRNQTLKDPTVLSDEDADAIAANLFVERNSGGFARGVGRLYFANPINIQVQITNRFFTASGLNFFPTEPISITAEEMVFSRSGALFYVDVALKAEAEGTSYNITQDDLSGVDGVFGAVKVGNPNPFTDGATKTDTVTFIAETREALTERSLVTRRGATARLRTVFPGQTRAIQVIGANDEEMQRDLLVAAAPGHSWMTGKVTVYNKVAFVQIEIVEGILADAPVAGDTLYLYLDPYSYSGAWSGLAQTLRFVTLTIEKVLVNATATANPYQVSYLLQFSGTLPQGVTLPNPFTVRGGLRRKGSVRISSLADIGPVSFSAPNAEVHMFGHSDVYVRPVTQEDSKTVVSSLHDRASYIERTSLITVSGSNQVQDTGLDYLASGVSVGDQIVIETGGDAGTYNILAVTGSSPSYLYLNSNMGATSNVGAVIKYRIIKQVVIDPFEPKIPKLPFGGVVCNDLDTVIGSFTLKLITNDLLTYGTAIGDTIRITSGVCAGDYVIKGFDSILGGKGPIVDVATPASEAFLTYEVFTAQDKVNKPLVRIKEILLLDSSNQSTGISVPPADPIAVVPVDQFSSARVRASSALDGGYVLPDFTGYVSGGNVAATVSAGNDYRYSAGFDAANGTYRAVTFTDAGTHESEFDFRTDANGSCSWFLATPENLEPVLNQTFPPIDPKIGECLTIKSGPNLGSYLIRNVVKFKFLDSTGATLWAYFVQVYGTFPNDILRQLISFLDDTSVASGNGAIAITKITGSTKPTFPDFFNTTYNSLGTKLDLALSYYGVTSPGASALQLMVDSVAKVSYEWGDSAKGTLRTYFTDPTAFEQWTALSNILTTYSYTNPTGGVINFIPTPTTYDKWQLVPAKSTTDTDPKEYPRDYNGAATPNLVFTDSSRPTVFTLGVQAADILAVHYEQFLGNTVSKLSQTAIATVAGSSQVTFYNMTVNANMVGYLLSIEEGLDKGMYRVTKYVNSTTLLLDSSMTVTTPTVLALDTVAQWGATGAGVNKVVSTNIDLTSYLNKWITLYGMNYNYQGSFRISAVNQGNIKSILVDRVAPNPVGDFPAFPVTGGYLVVTNAPVTNPVVSTVGTFATELFGLRPIRMYQGNPTERPLSSVLNSITISQITGLNVQDGYKNPYRIYRRNIRRITPTEMSLNQDGPLYYFDTDVVSLSPQDSANIAKDSYLTLLAGTYKTFGYRLDPVDNTLTYSTKEAGSLNLPLSILPVGSMDSKDNYINLFASPIQITYEQAPIVQQFQDFLDSPEDKVTAANMLARHFLPAYVSYDATYIGGAAASDVAISIIDYINSLPIETAVDVSVIEGKIIDHGGNPETPTKIVVVIHDWDRKIWAAFSENKLGGTTLIVPMNGTGRVSYFTAGPDVSGQTTIPPGERINLTKV